MKEPMPIVAININNGAILNFNSVLEASEELDITIGSIRYALTCLGNTSSNDFCKYIFLRKNEFEEFKSKPLDFRIEYLNKLK